MEALIDELSALGVKFTYLASWRDPYGDPDLYARRVFASWGLGEGDVLAVFLLEGGRWRVAGALGPGVGLSQGAFERLLREAEARANRAPPAHAAISLAEGLLELVQRGDLGEGDGGRPVWPYLLGGLLGLAALAAVLRARLCPRCGRPLRRRDSWLGIMLVCPRCGYTRAPRRGRGTGSRRGFYP